MMIWDDDEVYVPIQAEDPAASPRVAEIGQRNSLIFSTEDLKEQYHLLLRASKSRSSIKKSNVQKSQILPTKFVKQISHDKKSDPGNDRMKTMVQIEHKPNLPPMFPKRLGRDQPRGQTNELMPPGFNLGVYTEAQRDRALMQQAGQGVFRLSQYAKSKDKPEKSQRI